MAAKTSRVVMALILRDIKTRYFGNGLGYLIAIAWPVVHIIILLLIYSLTGRANPLGNSLVTFFAAGLMPTICFQYMTRFIMFSCLSNKPLLAFPVVSIFDIIVARAILEAACVVGSASLLLFILMLGDYEVSPWDMSSAVCAFLSSLLLGFGVGALNGVISLKFPGWSVFFLLVNIALWAASGVVFLPNQLPKEVQSILWWNPLLHCVEWMRESYFDGYHSDLLSKMYLNVFSLASILAALLMVKYFSQSILRG